MSIMTDNDLTMSIDKINDDELIILHNSNCDENFFNAVCEYLKCTDLIFITNTNAKKIKCDRGIFISLDQNYNISSHTMIFAPFHNERKGNSDLLTLAMYAAFNQRDFEVNGIRSGMVNINDVKENYSVTYEPFDCEEDIEPSRNISMTTIALSFYNLCTPKEVARAIFSGILRYEYHINSIHKDYDLLYRAHTNESLSAIAEILGCDEKELYKYNNLVNEVMDSPQVLINPVVEKEKVLSKTTTMHGTVSSPFYSKYENMLQ